MSLSANTQAILLLTAPLQIGRSSQQLEILTHKEYKQLAQLLRNEGLEPSDLLAERAQFVLDKTQPILDPDRLQALLGRGFQLSQAVEHWQARAIWVVSRADPDYPKRIKSQLKENAPAVFYGCGSKELLNSGGLAVVGSRHVDDTLIHYTENVGQLAAGSSVTIISGGARGIDQAAMRGALESSGRAIGVLADSLERAALQRENRDFLMADQLVLVSPYDPSAGFHVGTAMARNKLIYAFADAALVVSSDLQKGGTWAGAVEQLEKLHLTPVYIHLGSEPSPGLRALRQKGALTWPDPQTPAELQIVLEAQTKAEKTPASSLEFSSNVHEVHGSEYQSLSQDSPTSQSKNVTLDQEVQTGPQLILNELAKFDAAETAAEIAAALQMPLNETKKWLDRLVAEGKLHRKGKPAKYFLPGQFSLF